jgi:phospholipid/cholesterol/gamma-HCH transport system substrate-binding protein
MENKSHAIAAGIFVVAVAALLIALAAWLARDTTEQRVFELSSREGVTGLQPQAGVRYKGVSVGRVTAIELDSKVPGNVLVRIAVNDAAPITTSTFATLGFQGVTGLAFIQLDDTGESTQAVTRTGDALPRIPLRASLVSRLTDQGAQLLGHLEQASQRMNALLAPENQKNLMGAISNMGQAAAHASQLAQRVEQANLPQLIQEGSVVLNKMKETSERLGASGDAVKKSSDEFRRMSTRMSEPGGTLDKIAQGANALVATGQSVNTILVPRLSRTVDAVNENPQSLLLGKGAAQPGPGENGFVTPSPK